MSHAQHEPSLDPAELDLAKGSMWRRLPAVFLVVGIGGLVGAFALRGQNPQQFYFSYLTAYMTFLAIGLGGLFFVLLQHAVRAGWSIVVRRIAENAMITLPVMAVLAIPIFLGIHDLFHWSHIEAVEQDSVLLAKQAYLNESGFFTRGIIFLVIWTLFSVVFYRWSTQQDHASGAAVEALSHRMRAFAPLGLILFALTLTFAGIDWIMSLDPHWFSTIFGVYYFAGAVVSIHAFLAVVLVLLQGSGYLRSVVTNEHYHDIGKMMFAFSVFWAYIAFSQYMLIWYASIPEETYWFAYRGQGDWLTLSLVLVFGRFAIPFVLFMSRRWKRRGSTLLFWAFWMLTAQFIDMYWLIQPVLAHEHGTHEIHFGLVDVLTLLGIGGVFLGVFTWALGRRRLVPVGDPRLSESLRFENF